MFIEAFLFFLAIGDEWRLTHPANVLHTAMTYYGELNDTVMISHDEVSDPSPLGADKRAPRERDRSWTDE